MEVAIIAAIITAGVSILVFLAKQVFDLLQDNAKRNALEKTCLFVPLLFELQVLELAIMRATESDVLDRIVQYRNTADTHQDLVAENKFIIDCLARILAIIESEASKVYGFGRAKTIRALMQWQVQLKVVAGYLSSSFDDKDLISQCTLINREGFSTFGKMVNTRAGLKRRRKDRQCQQ